MSHLSDWTPREEAVIEFAARKGFAAAEIADSVPGRSLSAIGGKIGSIRARLGIRVKRAPKKTVLDEAIEQQGKIVREYGISDEERYAEYAAAWEREVRRTLRAREKAVEAEGPFSGQDESSGDKIAA